MLTGIAVATEYEALVLEVSNKFKRRPLLVDSHNLLIAELLEVCSGSGGESLE